MRMAASVTEACTVTNNSTP